MLSVQIERSAHFSADVLFLLRKKIRKFSDVIVSPCSVTLQVSNVDWIFKLIELYVYICIWFFTCCCCCYVCVCVWFSPVFIVVDCLGYQLELGVLFGIFVLVLCQQMNLI